MAESEYIPKEAEEHTKTVYLNDLRILRRFVQNGSFGYEVSGDVVFQTLKCRYPEARSGTTGKGMVHRAGRGVVPEASHGQSDRCLPARRMILPYPECYGYLGYRY